MTDRIERLAADPLADIKAKLRALRHKTLAQGCTEAEAMAAADKVAELMARYEIDAAELDRPAIVEIRIETSGVKAKNPWLDLWTVIGSCCQVRTWSSGPAIVYYGYEPDALMAEYLYEVMERHAENARAAFRMSHEFRKRRTKKTRTKAAQAFLGGFVEGLIRKLSRHFLERLKSPDAQAKKALLTIELERKDMQFRIVKPAGQNFVRHEAFGAGHQAARNVEIQTGIDGDRGGRPGIGETRLLGRSS
jgi:hypothetical protein